MQPEMHRCSIKKENAPPKKILCEMLRCPSLCSRVQRSSMAPKKSWKKKKGRSRRRGGGTEGDGESAGERAGEGGGGEEGEECGASGRCGATSPAAIRVGGAAGT